MRVEEDSEWKGRRLNEQVLSGLDVGFGQGDEHKSKVTRRSQIDSLVLQVTAEVS